MPCNNGVRMEIMPSEAGVLVDFGSDQVWRSGVVLQGEEFRDLHGRFRKSFSSRPVSRGFLMIIAFCSILDVK